MSMRNLSVETILDPVPGLPAEFRYPVGYFMPLDRVTDPAVLAKFPEVLRPFVVATKDGNAELDPHVPVPVKHLERPTCGNLKAVIRFLELGGEPDESMKATYATEDLLAHACHLSQSGQHGMALEVLRSLPKPFQETAAALEGYVHSLKALGRYEEALACAEKLIEAPDVRTEYARTLFRIDRADILVLLGRGDEAEKYLDDHREEFEGFYTYYGVRSALALRRGDTALAESLILKAGQADSFHAFKLLWNPGLRPLADFIRRELLTEDGKPLLYHRNVETRRLIHAIQGAVLTGDMRRAMRLSEGIIVGRITDWDCAHEAYLAAAGLGRFKVLERWTHTLPKCRQEDTPPRFVRTVLEMLESNTCEDKSWLEKLAAQGADQKEARAFQKLASDAKRIAGDRLAYGLETRIAEVAGKWSEQGRHIWLMTLDENGRFAVDHMMEPRQRRRAPVRFDPRDAFPAVEDQIVLQGTRQAASWIEEKLSANVGVKVRMYSNNPYTLDFNGWGLLRGFGEEDLRDFPHLLENWRIAAGDPNFYFSNGTLFSFGMHTPFETRFYQALFNFLRRRTD